MNFPTIKGSPVHKASIAKAKYAKQPTVSQSRTTADPSLVAAGDQYGKSLVPEAIDFRIKSPKVTWDKTKKDTKDIKDAVVNNKRDSKETTTVTTSEGTPVSVTGDEDIIVDQSYLNNLPVGDREEGSFGEVDYAGMELPEEEFADPTIQTSLNTQTPSITSSVAPPAVSNSDMLRAEILNYDGTPNNLPRNQAKIVSLPVQTASASATNEQPQLVSSTTSPPETTPDNTTLAENNPKYALHIENHPEFGSYQDNRVRISDTEGYGLINNDGDIIITYNGYKVDKYEEIPSDIFNDMTEFVNEGTDEDGRPTHRMDIINDPNVVSETSPEVNNSRLPVINNNEQSQTVIGPREATEQEKQEASEEIANRGLEPISKEEEEKIIYEKPSRFDYPIDMDEPSKGKVNPKTKGMSYNEALRLYEEQEKNSAAQQRTQSIFRNAVPGGKVQTKLKEEGFNPYKSI